MAIFTKRYHAPGTSPGTLVEREPETAKPLSIHVVDYTDSEFAESRPGAVSELAVYLEKPSTTWIHFDGYCPPDVLQQMGALYGLHSLALEDVMNTGQRPKIESYDNELFVILSRPLLDDNGMHSEQLSFFLGHNYVLSFYNGTSDLFVNVRKRLQDHIGKIRSRKADYLLYTLMDTVVDEAFPVLESYGEFIEALDEELLEKPTKSTLHKIHGARRELLLIRRVLWPQREIINTLIRDEDNLLEETTKLFFRDCYDHTIQTMEVVEIYREVISNILEVYLSTLSHRANEIMRVLTVIATIFIPLTFIAGVYGMNFGNKSNSPWAMPELNWYYGYPVLWLIMLGVAAGMLYYFRRKQWF
ncbi:MAG: magnesium/cobalt transporter CorA [Gammaproteobacteria bacterium]|nr:magnesium/cobalt transporter CorA [Gammaproteobacteria bacterium]